MGMFDSIYANCPNCGEENEFQTKGGECTLECYTLENCPLDALSNANRHSPYSCSCGASLSIDIERRSVLVG
jgi:hypothetical protein